MRRVQRLFWIEEPFFYRLFRRRAEERVEYG
jgi:hypothetical protein